MPDRLWGVPMCQTAPGCIRQAATRQRMEASGIDPRREGRGYQEANGGRASLSTSPFPPEGQGYNSVKVYR
jgi:hypothetical protein